MFLKGGRGSDDNGIGQVGQSRGRQDSVIMRLERLRGDRIDDAVKLLFLTIWQAQCAKMMNPLSGDQGQFVNDFEP